MTEFAVKNYLLSLALAILVTLAPAAVQAQEANPKDQQYLDLVAKANANPAAAIDWAALRQLYTQTSFYDPYGGAQAIWYGLQQAGQVIATDPSEANVKAYRTLLDRHFAHYRAHLQAIDFWNKTKSPLINKEFHERAFRDILRSIRLTGDGKTPATAFRVIDPAEEQMILKTFHFRLVSQEFRQNKSRPLDVLKYVNPQTSAPTDKPQVQEMFFDVTAIVRAQPAR
ncbi:MAG TPA: DUF4919 domain-containing protein [Patescibacteria group bacterium]|nr:DUF4919 domain-containing protein [Patescibacteria group bacterium]